MTSNAELIAEVIAYNADAEDSHYAGCYQRHAGCLAVMLRDAEPTVSRSHNLRAGGANAELIERLRSVAGFDHLPRTDLAVLAADALETSDALVKELEAQVKNFKCEQVFRISEMQELLEAQQRIAELEEERDAALAAVERVRAIAERHGVKSWTEEIFAALDGAPVIDEAAAGVVPQAPKDIHEPSHDRVYCVRCGGNWPCQPAPSWPHERDTGEGGGSMTEYTPTTEQVIEAYVESQTDYAMPDHLNESAHRERVMRWLAAHDAEVAARALEEAAVGIFVRPASADAVYDALRARAAKYRKAVE